MFFEFLIWGYAIAVIGNYLLIGFGVLYFYHCQQRLNALEEDHILIGNQRLDGLLIEHTLMANQLDNFVTLTNSIKERLGDVLTQQELMMQQVKSWFHASEQCPNHSVEKYPAADFD